MSEASVDLRSVSPEEAQASREVSTLARIDADLGGSGDGRKVARFIGSAPISLDALLLQLRANPTALESLLAATYAVRLSRAEVFACRARGLAAALVVVACIWAGLGSPIAALLAALCVFPALAKARHADAVAELYRGVLEGKTPPPSALSRVAGHKYRAKRKS